MFYHFLRKLPVCGEGNVLFLNCRIYPNLFYFSAYILFSKQIYTPFEDFFHPPLTDALAKLYKITRVKRIFILKVNLPTKMLTIWTVYIPLQNSLITKIIYLFKAQKPNYCPDSNGRSLSFSI